MPSIFVHAILDGRDTPPMSARKYVRELLTFIDDKPQVHLSTFIGRFFTMDRDKRWDRVKRGYDLMTLGIGIETTTPFGSIERHYEAGVTDEFMDPHACFSATAGTAERYATGTRCSSSTSARTGCGRSSPRSATTDFEGFDRSVVPEVDLISMTSYHEDYNLPVLFSAPPSSGNLGEVFSRNGMKQLRIAETEKFAHVTYFFNGGSDQVFPDEDRTLIPSPKIATYDRKPEMSVFELAEAVVEAIRSKSLRSHVLNIANPDMVGHTGVMDAAVAAVEATDKALARILEAVEEQGGVALITADHGNAEIMFDPATGQPHTAHTSSPVPLILFDPTETLRQVEERRSAGECGTDHSADSRSAKAGGDDCRVTSRSVPMIERLILVRHGETVHNVSGIAQGWSDSDLSESGTGAGRELARRVRSFGPSAVYSSSLPRAMTTAKTIATALKLEMIVLDELREMNCGRWEGQPFIAVRRDEADYFARWSADPTVPCPEGESYRRRAREVPESDGPGGNRLGDSRGASAAGLPRHGHPHRRHSFAGHPSSECPPFRAGKRGDQRLRAPRRQIHPGTMERHEPPGGKRMILEELTERLTETLRSRVLNIFGHAVERVVMQTPPKLAMGDLASPLALELARVLKKSPRQIAEGILDGMELPPLVRKASIEGAGYLNFQIDRGAFAAAYLPAVMAPPAPAGQRVLVEHTNINPNKAAHIGHLRNAVLGDTLVRCLRWLGNRVETQNYIDDTGVQLADVVVGFEKLLGESDVRSTRAHAGSRSPFRLLLLGPLRSHRWRV